MKISALLFTTFSLVLLLSFVGFIYAQDDDISSDQTDSFFSLTDDTDVVYNADEDQFQQIILSMAQSNGLSSGPGSDGSDGGGSATGTANGWDVLMTATGNFNPGGQIIFDFDGGSQMANLPFVFVFSASGDYPGFPFFNTVFPLNFPYLFFVKGLLDPTGHGQMVLPLSRDPRYIGARLNVAVLAVNPFTFQFFSSNPVTFVVGRGLDGFSCCTQGVKGSAGSTCTDGGGSVDYCRFTAGGAVQECIPNDIGQDPPPTTNITNFRPTNTTANTPFINNLTRDIGLSNITTRVYNATTYDCDDFASDMERWLQGLGYSATYTQYVKYKGVNSSDIDYAHAVADVHLPDGSLLFIEPQNGRIINLDFDGDGMVEAHENKMYRHGHHPTDNNAKIYVYDDAATAAANGAPRD